MGIWFSRSLLFFIGYVVAISLSVSSASMASPRKSPASSAKQLERPAPRINTIAIISSDKMATIERLDSKTDRARAGGNTGAITGGSSGAVMGATSCSPAGPLGALLCAIVLGSIGGMAGGVAGSMYGMTGISDIDALYLNETLTFLDQKRNLQNELALRVQNLLSPGAQAPPFRADALAVATLTNIQFAQSSKEHIYFSASASMILVENSNIETPYQITSEFTVNSPSENIDRWLNDDGTNLEEAIDECLDRMAILLSDSLSRVVEIGRPPA